MKLYNFLLLCAIFFVKFCRFLSFVRIENVNLVGIWQSKSHNNHYVDY